MKIFKFKHVLISDTTEISVSGCDSVQCRRSLKNELIDCPKCAFYVLCIIHRRFVTNPEQDLKRTIKL